MHKIFHIDVNSAYLSWEAVYRLQRGDSLDLRTVPSIVGGDIEKRHGIVLAKSIPAKAYKIKTGEPIVSAVKKCPSLISIPPNYQRYVTASNAMVDLVKEYSPLVQRYSIDEVFMDFNSQKEDPLLVAHEIKDKIERDLGFTVNIGIGDNKLLAKMASDFKKPNMVHTLYKEEVQDKMWPLPIADLFMVGSRTEKKMKSRGIETIGDLARLNKDYVYDWLKKPGLMVWEFANGIENSRVRNTDLPIKSVGNSTTIAFDVEKEEEALKIILALCEMVGYRLRAISMKAFVVHVGLKDQDFFSMGMERKLYSPTNATEKIYAMAKNLFYKVWNKMPIRQISVRASSLIKDDRVQLSFFDYESDRSEAFNQTIDDIRNKYGLKSVYRSSFLHSGISPIIGGVMEDLDYPMMSSQLD